MSLEVPFAAASLVQYVQYFYMLYCTGKLEAVYNVFLAEVRTEMLSEGADMVTR